jgi:hypothetical protein
MRTVRLLPSSEKGHVELDFAYDRELVGVVRALRDRRWDLRRGRWIVSRSDIDRLILELERRGVRTDAAGLGVGPDGTGR